MDTALPDKLWVSHAENYFGNDVTYDMGQTHNRGVDIDEGFDPQLIKRIVRKVDVRLIPILSAMYCISLILRYNLGVARLTNNGAMQADLGLDVSNRFSICTLVFFIPYILLEIPSQLGLRYFGARWWLGTSVLLWGFVLIGMGFVNTWGELALTRAILGAFESTLFPGAAYIIACWYPRKMMARRQVLFYVLSNVMSGLGAVMAYGLSQLHGRGGRAGWRWVFIIQGVLTSAIALLGYTFIVDFPDKATFLTEEEREVVEVRIYRDRGDVEYDPMTWSKFRRYMGDMRLWLFAFMFGSSTLGMYSLAYFLPVLLSKMGFSNGLSQLLVAPPYAFSALPALATAYLADNYRNGRAAAVALNAFSLLVGTCMYAYIPEQYKAARYVGVFFATAGCTSNVPLIISWSQTSIRTQSKRGFASALIVGFGGIGGIVAALVFMESQAERDYPAGIAVTLGLNATVILICFCLNRYFAYQNSRANCGEIEIEGDASFRYQG